jgi:diadenosine tetraphosphate (Ap4A) HIT family hydrolase
MPGHLLVIPKRHVERMSELDDTELLELTHVVNTYCDKILRFAKGYMVKNNFMPFLEESRLKVNHMHIHILPRVFNDDLYSKALFNESTLYQDLTDEEYEDILKKLGD